MFCSSKDYETKITFYKGSRLLYVPFRANGVQSTIYDIVSLIKTIGRFDVVVILGVSGCIFLPLFRLLFKGKIIVNIDGLEHKRAKWGGVAKRFLRLSEAVSVKYANVIIADNKGIQDYVFDTYKEKSELIAYGGDHVLVNLDNGEEQNILNKYGLKSDSYCLAVSRIEPENNCYMILEAFAQNKQHIVYVGNWEQNWYGKSMCEKYSQFENIQIVNSVYDLNDLYTLRKNCKFYVHGHSAGGTNPSLVEAMFFGVPIFAFDVIYNRETSENKACYFTSERSLSSLLEGITAEESRINGASMREIARRRYTWKEISRQYEGLY